MKNMSEYSFRDLAGHFFRMRFPNGRRFPDPDFDEYIAYGYIDVEAGITLEVIGGYDGKKLHRNPESSTKIRYDECIELEPYDDPNEEMLEVSNFIEENYTPDWIGPVRADERFDPYRDKAFPDDMLIPVNTIIDGKRITELLWMRPGTIHDNMLLGMSIEPGRVVPEGTVAAIVQVSDFVGDRKYTISAMTMEMIKYIAKSDDPQSFFRQLS